MDRFIPLDKSWMIRLGVLDLLHGYDDMQMFLSEYKPEALSSDLQALLRASQQWNTGKQVDVGESGTLLRFLQFASWKLNKPVKFIKHGTLAERKIVSDQTIVGLPLSELLLLDNGTSQWASAAVLLGNTQPKPNPLPFKLRLTYEAMEHWQKARDEGRRWKPRFDQTIRRQAQAFIHWRHSGKMQFTPEQAEDYCFARAFDLMTPEEGERRWPSLRQHESDRIASMELALQSHNLDSADHRVIQAVAMRRGQDVTYANPSSVTKSWPLFWEFLEYADKLHSI